MVFRVLLDRKSAKVGDERSKYCGVKNVIPGSLIRINTQTAVKIIIKIILKNVIFFQLCVFNFPFVYNRSLRVISHQATKVQPEGYSSEVSFFLI